MKKGFFSKLTSFVFPVNIYYYIYIYHRLGLHYIYIQKYLKYSRFFDLTPTSRYRLFSILSQYYRSLVVYRLYLQNPLSTYTNR